MKKIFFAGSLTVFLFFLALTVPTNCSAAIVGAIRWDDWYGNLDKTGHATEITLGPSAYHYRVPFFGNIISNSEVQWSYSQQVMDQEIAYAKASGLSYWAFMLYYPSSQTLSAAFDYYLTSSHINDINFAGIASGKILTRETFSSDEDKLFSFMAKPSYQKVLGDRPLLYYFNPAALATNWGSNSAVKQMFMQFRQDAQNRGLGDPYIVLLDYNIAQAASLNTAYGTDAISSYALSSSTITGPTTYQDLGSYVEGRWNQQKNTGSKVIPLVMSGWDRRPRIENPVPWETWQQQGVGINIYYQKASPTEIVDHLKQAVNWSTNNPQVNPANAILIYAWNENDEGGWLTPTIYEGDARLQEIAKYLKGSNFTTPRYKGRDVNNNNVVDIRDYQQLVSDFGKSVDPIPLNSDITGDGKVNIFDYNTLVQTYTASLIPGAAAPQ